MTAQQYFWWILPMLSHECSPIKTYPENDGARFSLYGPCFWCVLQNGTFKFTKRNVGYGHLSGCAWEPFDQGSGPCALLWHPRSSRSCDAGAQCFWCKISLARRNIKPPKSMGFGFFRWKRTFCDPVMRVSNMVFCPLTFLTRPERPHQRCGLEDLRVQQVLTHNQSTIKTMKYTMNIIN